MTQTGDPLFIDDTMQAYTHWAGIRDSKRGRDLQAYMTNLAEARFVLRRVLRIVDMHTREHGLDPLAHHVLLQVYGTNRGRGIAVNALAKRLDIPPALASRLVGVLEKQKLVKREPSTEDRRVINVSATPLGIERLREVDNSIHFDIIRFHRQLTDEERDAALSIFAFYVGLNPASAATRGVNASESGQEDADIASSP